MAASQSRWKCGKIQREKWTNCGSGEPCDGSAVEWVDYDNDNTGGVDGIFWLDAEWFLKAAAHIARVKLPPKNDIKFEIHPMKPKEMA